MDQLYNPGISKQDMLRAKQKERERQRKKKERQWQRWAEDVIPSLIRPHLDHLRARNVDIEKDGRLDSTPCSCGQHVTTIHVVAVYFESKW